MGKIWSPSSIWLFHATKYHMWSHATKYAMWFHVTKYAMWSHATKYGMWSHSTKYDTLSHATKYGMRSRTPNMANGPVHQIWHVVPYDSTPASFRSYIDYWRRIAKQEKIDFRWFWENGVQIQSFVSDLYLSRKNTRIRALFSYNCSNFMDFILRFFISQNNWSNFYQYFNDRKR